MSIPAQPSLKKKLAEATKKWKAISEQEKESRRALPTSWKEFSRKTSIVSGGKVLRFVSYDYQDLLIETIEKSQSTCVLKSRQMGVSEALCNWLLMRALTEKGFKALVISKTQKDSSDLSERTRKMALSLGDECPPFETESRTKLAWTGLGCIDFLPSTPRAARSIASISVLLIDEAAFVDKIDQIYQAATPTLSMLGDKAKVVLCSTPNGKSGLFWEILASSGDDTERVEKETQALRDEASSKHVSVFSCGDWSKVLLHWRAHPIYGMDLGWAEKQRSKHRLTKRQWAIEYELEVSESGRLIFDEQSIDRCTNGRWEEPREDRRYICGIDPAFGGQDFWVTQVWDVTEDRYLLVAEYRENHKAKDYNLSKTLELISRYRPTQVNCEANGGGSLIVEELVKLSRVGASINAITTSKTSKLVSTDRLSLLMERGLLSVPPGCSLAHEVKHFVELTGGTRGADSGFHDDSVMAAAIALSFVGKGLAGQWIDDLILNIE